MFFEKAQKGNNRWYLYIFTILFMFIAMSIAQFPLLIYSNWGNLGALMEGTPVLINNTNASLALLLFSYAVALLSLIYGIRKIHSKQLLDVVTGRPHFDYKRMFYGMAVWGCISLLTLLFQYFTGGHSTLIFQFDPAKFFMMCLVVILFIPFQVAWEEVLFRGYLMQGFYLLFRNRWMPFLLSGIIFGLMHGANPEVEAFGFLKVMPQYIIMGLLMGYVTIKDDGIELAMGLHLINNLLSSILITHKASALQTHALFIETAPTASHWDSLVMLISAALFIIGCNYRFHFLKGRSFPVVDFLKKS